MAWTVLKKLKLGTITRTDAQVGPASDFRAAINNNDTNIINAIYNTSVEMVDSNDQTGVVGAINTMTETIDNNIKELPQVLIGSGDVPPTPVSGRSIKSGDIWLQVTLE